jgi:cytosine/adenosine deaminase-related metal-dependent hydrolase
MYSARAPIIYISTRSTLLLTLAHAWQRCAFPKPRASYSNMAPVTATLLIKNGTVIDGTGTPSFVGDIAVDGELIVAVGPNLEVAGTPRIIDADGLLVCPGWVDVHTHCAHTLCPLRPPQRERGERAYVVEQAAELAAERQAERHARQCI